MSCIHHPLWYCRQFLGKPTIDLCRSLELRSPLLDSETGPKGYLNARLAQSASVALIDAERWRLARAASYFRPERSRHADAVLGRNDNAYEVVVSALQKLFWQALWPGQQRTVIGQPASSAPLADSLPSLRSWGLLPKSN
jgi:hypothetical protein